MIELLKLTKFCVRIKGVTQNGDVVERMLWRSEARVVVDLNSVRVLERNQASQVAYIIFSSL